MTSADLKAAALQWLRFVRRYEIVCTEAGTYGLADVLAMSETAAVEIEVKTSKSDLNREFVMKDDKHAYYKNVEGGRSPNYFYFLVPEHLADAAVGLALQHNPKYGVISMPEGGTYMQLSVVRKPSKLHSVRPSPRQVRIATARMSSELASLYAAVHDLQKDVVAKFETGFQSVIAAAVKTAGNETTPTAEEIWEAACSEP